MAYLLGVDTGGTYTDAVILDPDAAQVLGKAKALTTRSDLSQGIGAAVDAALAAAGIAADQTYLTNAVKHFRFTRRGKRRMHEKPGLAHIAACHPWLDAELASVRPGIVVCLGATAARAVLGHDVKIGEVRGLIQSMAGVPEPVLVTVHPSAVVRLYGRDGWDEAFQALVADLKTAAAVVG